MAVGDLVHEALREILGWIFWRLFYGIGYVVVKAVSLGNIPIAPLKTAFRRPKKGEFWSLWQTSGRKKTRSLKAATCVFAGIAAAAAFGGLAVAIML